MARGLSDTDIDGLRQQLDAGKRPRVQLSGPHFPVGAVGTVVRIGQPEVDGADYLRVRVKVDNMTDELAFGPTELKLPGRPTKTVRRAPARATSIKKTPVTKAETAPPGEPLIEPAPAPAKTAPVKRAAAVKTPPVKAAPTKASPTRRKSGPIQKVTFTVASTGATWSLTATRGSKNVVKNIALTPGLVSALAELLDQPALIEAIGEINDAALAEAQLRADQLRAELSQLEAVLATHTRP